MSTSDYFPYSLQVARSRQQQEPLKQFIQMAYTREFSASIPHFLPLLLGLYDEHSQLIGACGVNPATSGSLYLEHYLNAPVENIISQRLAESSEKTDTLPVTRTQIAEIGNLAVSNPGNGRLLFAALCRFLLADGYPWVTFTGTQKLRNSLHRLHLNPLLLANAHAEQVGADAGAWGNYYHCAPQVMAGNIHDSLAILTRISPSVRLMPSPSLSSLILPGFPLVWGAC
ncbi:MAG: thermostable hemolysin [Plesiomonas sp.]